MTLSHKTLVAAVGAAALASGALASGAMAQDRPQPSAAPNNPGQHWAEHRQERQAKRMQALHDVLNIRADQEPAFQAFTVALTPRHDGKDHGQAPAAAPAPLTTPERLDREVARANEREQRLQTRVTAVKAFYQVLSPEQRRAFDALDMLHGDRRDRFGGHHRA